MSFTLFVVVVLHIYATVQYYSQLDLFIFNAFLSSSESDFVFEMSYFSLY